MLVLLIIILVIISSLSLIIGFDELLAVRSLQADINTDIQVVSVESSHEYHASNKRNKQIESLVYSVIAFFLSILLIWYLPIWFYEESLYWWVRGLLILPLLPLLIEQILIEEFPDGLKMISVSLIVMLIIIVILSTMYFMQ